MGDPAKDAKNFEVIKKMRDEHDNGGCPHGNKAVAVAVHPFDMERLEWEEGDTIAGLKVVSDENTQPGCFNIICLGPEPPPEREVEDEEDAGIGFTRKIRGPLVPT